VNYEDNAVKTASNCLYPLLDNHISSCYAAAMTEQTSQFTERCEEIKRLQWAKVFFQQVNSEATRVHTGVGNEITSISMVCMNSIES
jgi:hypothetical protein